MTIAPDGDPGRRPMRADAADDPAQMAAHLLARRSFARPQNDGDGASRGGVVNMDRKKAALVVMRIEQRQLLMANGWKREREKAIVDHGGCGFDVMA